MRRRLTEFVQGLRDAGVRISVAETLDAMAAVGAAGLAPAVLREALSAALIKDEADRGTFDAAFDRFFAAPPAAGRGPGRRREDAPRGEGGGAGGRGAAGGTSARPGTVAKQPPEETRPRGEIRPGARPRTGPASPVEREAARPTAAEKRVAARAETTSRRDEETTPEGRGSNERKGAEARDPTGPREASRRDGRRGARDLVRRDLREMDASEVGAARDAARELGRRFAARSSRRERRAKRGRIDVRRTIRASLGRGGALIDLARRGRRPGKPHLVALCDVSGSVARSTEMLLEILAGAETAFARVTRFAFVDRLVPIGFEGGHVTPDGPIDLHARSDLGRVLCEFEATSADRIDRSTVLVLLGDARNNRLPPRGDVLRRLRRRARAVLFAVAEPRTRWNTGDSALSTYAPSCDLVVEATSIDGLVRTLRAAARGGSVASPESLR